jgi:hypothetical protein
VRPFRLIAIVVLAAASVCVASPALADTQRDGKRGNGNATHPGSQHGDSKGKGHGHDLGRLHLKVRAMTCIGDTLSATVTGSGPAGTVLIIRPVALGRDHRVAVGNASSVVTLPLPAGGSQVRLDVAALRARAYQVVVYAGPDRVAQSNAVPAGSCAPGHEVPEAPVAMLAPLTMLGTIALGAWRLRIPARKVA